MKYPATGVSRSAAAEITRTLAAASRHKERRRPVAVAPRCQPKGGLPARAALHGELRPHHADGRSPLGHLHADGSNVAQGVRIVIVHRDFGLAPAGVGGKVTSIRPPALS